MSSSGTVNQLSHGKQALGNSFQELLTLPLNNSLTVPLRSHAISVYYLDGNFCRGMTLI